MRRKITTALAWCIIALSAVSTPGSAHAASEASFSTATNQYGTAGNGATVLQHGIYSTRNGIQPLVTPFVSSFLGLNGMAVDGQLIYFSVLSRGLEYFNSPIPILLEADCAYRYDTRSGAVTPLDDWALRGTRLGNLDGLDVLWDGSIVFSTEKDQHILQNGTTYSLLDENVYRFDPANGMFDLFFDGQALGLSGLDAVDVLESGRVVFSTPANQFVVTPEGGMVLRHQNAYLVRDLGILELALDGIAFNLRTLDAINMDLALLAVDGELVHWSVLAGGSGRHDLVRGNLLELVRSRGDFSVSTLECLASAQAERSVLYPANPDPGEGFWFVMRETGDSYDSGASTQVGSRDAGIAASGAGCP